MIDELLSLIAPHHCYNCGGIGRVLCDCCKNNILQKPYSQCVLCGKALAKGAKCSVHNTPYHQMWCISQRTGVIAKLIDQYKFHQVREVYKVLARLLDDSLPDFSPETIIVPVPTIARHIRQRGYDHMLLIARRLASHRGLSVQTLLVRRSNAVQHFAKTASQRRFQAKRFFDVYSKLDPKKHYLILDDIFTTGATIEAAARALKKAGAVRVSVAVIARQGEA